MAEIDRSVSRVRKTVHKALYAKTNDKKKSFLGYIYVVNLDPAVLIISFGANIDIRATVRYKDVMKEYGLGPNGGILTSLKGEDFFIGTKTVPLHHVPTPHRIADIDIGHECQY
ncbi:hypothetical protein C2845_PM01G44760 [Panicum miliaceum]|uniref:GPN-loop GTPase n=1 Tax=Panicum miliaceum TaxID=4540 RepID=A0A3L6TQC1_PANMI|nr:hypothetical protein C2845_PM01G44760 [Panicum miliaceum]